MYIEKFDIQPEVHILNKQKKNYGKQNIASPSGVQWCSASLMFTEKLLRQFILRPKKFTAFLSVKNNITRL